MSSIFSRALQFSLIFQIQATVDEFDSKRSDIVYVKLISSNSLFSLLLLPLLPSLFLLLNVRVLVNFSRDSTKLNARYVSRVLFFSPSISDYAPRPRRLGLLLLGCRPAQTSGLFSLQHRKITTCENLCDDAHARSTHGTSQRASSSVKTGICGRVGVAILWDYSGGNSIIAPYRSAALEAFIQSNVNGDPYGNL